jgi:hypothetical protein
VCENSLKSTLSANFKYRRGLLTVITILSIIDPSLNAYQTEILYPFANISPLSTAEDLGNNISVSV